MAFAELAGLRSLPQDAGVRRRDRPSVDQRRHLVNITRRLQRRLTWDPVQEQFPGDAEANKLVDRPRRKGYELPNPV